VSGALHSELPEDHAKNAIGPVVASTLGAILTLICVGWALNVPSRLGVAFYTEQLLVLAVGLAVGVIFFSLSWRGKPHAGRLPLIDILFGIAAVFIGCWMSTQYQRLLDDVSYYTPEIVALSVLIVPLVLEALRRCTGMALLLIVIFFVCYGLVAHYAPMALRGKPADFIPLITYLAFDTNAMLGSPVKVGAEIVILFLLMGEALIRAGGGEFFIDLARSLLGKKRGGPAKICVVGSGLFGMISGSAVSNVASIGPLTIPMMIRTGYPPKIAGAIEAVGSTGGQLMPPVMGAAAFLMAEALQLPYAAVVVAAIIPSLLYYLALFVAVDLEAARRGIGRAPVPGLTAREALRRGWHFPIPFAVLVGALIFYARPPEEAALLTTALLCGFALAFGYGGQRTGPGQLLDALLSTGKAVVDVIVICAAAGLVIGILNLTGAAFGFTLQLLAASGSHIWTLIVLTAIVSVVLGMGMPTVGVYVLLATLIAPAMIQMGIRPMAAHMYVMYFGMLSMITPPVALAAYAAANIARTDAWSVGWQAVRVGWSVFVLPFCFIANPALLADGPALEIAWDVARMVIGIWAGTAGMVGFGFATLSPGLRAALLMAAVLAIFPALPWGLSDAANGAGVLLALVLIVPHALRARRARG